MSNVTAGLMAAGEKHTMNEQQSLFCRIDQVDAIAEYGEGMPCIRFVGVQPAEFNTEAFADGVTTFRIDWVSMHDPAIRIPFESGDLCSTAEDCNICVHAWDQWFEVRYRQTAAAAPSTLYAAFGLAAPTPIQVLSVTSVASIKLPVLPTYRPRNVSQEGYTLYGYEVGQGMSSLLHNGRDGFLFDAGAGKPIHKTPYQANALTRYDLRSTLSGLQVEFFLSHGDSDHWRMLEWDQALRRTISAYVLPDGIRTISFFDKAVRHQTYQLNCATPFVLGADSRLDIHRTAPPTRTSNNDGLIAVFERDGRRALLPGDCAYAEMYKDASVAALLQQDYAAINVPHHGAFESATHVPAAASRGLAFFSAGNVYGHPRAEALAEHKAQGYAELQNVNATGIREFTLL